MKSEYYWKVVATTDRPGVFESSSRKFNPFRVEYKFGETTFPSVGRLLVFKTRLQARFFKKIEGDSNLRIFKVKVTDPKEIHRLAILVDDVSVEYIARFWRLIDQSTTDGMFAPYGSYSVTSVTLVSKE